MPDEWRATGPLDAAPPGEGEVDIWRLGVDRDIAERLVGILAPGERERAARYRSRTAYERFVAGRGAARVILGGLCGVTPDAVRFRLECGRCGSTEHGKAYLVSPNAGLEFNVSHSSGFVLVAVAHGTPVGVDIERARPGIDVDALGRRVLTEFEWEAFERVPRAERPAVFLRAWTRKEAYGKARGTGMSGLARIDVTPLAPGPVIPHVLDDPGEGADWRIDDLRPPPGYAAAVAAGADFVPRCWTLDPGVLPG
jgi:4'-phosphopantetheinyl transferase